MLEHAVKSSDVRKDFSSYVDEVIHNAPKIVSRTRDHFIMMNLQHIETLMQDIEIHITIERDSDGSFLATITEIEDIFASADNKNDAISKLAQELIDYATEYLDTNFTLYFNAPNRRKHFPYVMKVMMQRSITDVINLFSVEPKRS